MFLMEEKIAPSGSCCAMIYMRPDGLFEGRIYPRGQEAVAHGAAEAGAESFEMCCIPDTLVRAQCIVYEEIGLSAWQFNHK